MKDGTGLPTSIVWGWNGWTEAPILIGGTIGFHTPIGMIVQSASAHELTSLFWSHTDELPDMSNHLSMQQHTIRGTFLDGQSIESAWTAGIHRWYTTTLAACKALGTTGCGICCMHMQQKFDLESTDNDSTRPVHHSTSVVLIYARRALGLGFNRLVVLQPNLGNRCKRTANL